MGVFSNELIADMLDKISCKNGQTFLSYNNKTTNILSKNQA